VAWPAILTLLALALAGLTAPGATALPRVAVPPKPPVYTDEQLAQLVLDDPRLRREIVARDRWSIEEGERNLAALWFNADELYIAVADVVLRRLPPGTSPAEAARAVDEVWRRVVTRLTQAEQDIAGEMFRHAQAPGLFDKLGVGAEGRVLEISAANVRGAHSEQRIVARVLAALQGTVSQPVLGYGATGHTRAVNLLHAVKLGGVSSRGYCAGKCTPLLRYSATGTSAFEKNSVFLAPYVKKIDKTASAARVGTVANLALAEYRRQALAQQSAVVNAAAAGPNATHADKIAQGTVQQKQAEQKKAQQGGGCAPGAGAGAGAFGPAPGAAVVAAGACPGRGGLASAVASAGPGDYGGIDFSSLELRYVSADAGSDWMRYAFAGKRPEVGFRTDPVLGEKVIRTAGEDLHTWLALDPSAFWVNLNLNEPNRITDRLLGQTNAGRVLLEADLQLKRTSSRLMDPKTPTGKRYWAERAALDGACSVSRMWIVPGRVEVRVDGDELYVLQAPLDVKTVAEEPVGEYARKCQGSAVADKARSEDLDRRILLPHIVKAVNTAPEYAALRRAFVTRVVAEWIRGRHAEGRRTPFDDVIGSGDVGPAKLRDGWQPRQVFDAFVRASNSKEFTFTRTVREGNTVFVHEFVTGGVDLSKTPMSAVDAATMERRFPRLPGTVRTSLDRPAPAADGTVWLGGTAPVAEVGTWSRVTGTAGDFVAGRGGMLLVVLVALAVVALGLRGSRRRAAT
jgi:hypothetical protein